MFGAETRLSELDRHSLDRLGGGHEPRPELLGRHGPGQEISLGQVASGLAQRGVDVVGLHPLAHHPSVEVVTEVARSTARSRRGPDWRACP